MGKETKTNAMRMLEREKIPYRLNQYECGEFIDGMDVADKLGQDYETVFKTLVTVGKSGQHYVYVIPVHRELDRKKAASAVGEKSVEMLPVRQINQVTGYIRGGCTPIGMKKQFPTVIHESAVGQQEIAVSGGRQGVQLVLAPEDLVRAAKAQLADIIKE